MNQPLISIVLPSRNRAYCLRRAIGSIVAQTWRNWELILIDDGSTDETPELSDTIARALGGRYRSARLEGEGASAARNLGISMARGEWVAFQDSDDMWMPEKLGMQMERIRQTPNCVFSFTDWFDFYDEGYGAPRHIIGSWADEAIYPELLRIRSNLITCPSVVASRHALQEAGGFDPSMRVCEDIDLWARLARCGTVAAVRVPLVGVHVRRGEGFPYAASLMGRRDLLTRARARDSSIPEEFWLEMRAEALAVYIEIASTQGNEAVRTGLATRLRRRPVDPIEDLAEAARDVSSL